MAVEPYFIGLWFNVVDVIAYGSQVDHVWLTMLLDYGDRHQKTILACIKGEPLLLPDHSSVPFQPPSLLGDYLNDKLYGE